MTGLYIKIGAFLAIIAALIGLHHHIDRSGYERGVAEQVAINTKVTIAAQAKLLELNAKLRDAQTGLTNAQAIIANKQTELDHEKANSADYQSRLAAGIERMRVLVRSSKVADSGSPASSSTASMDKEPAFDAYLEPSVAIGLERIRLNENEAIARLNACIASYDAVKEAADSIK